MIKYTLINLKFMKKLKLNNQGKSKSIECPNASTWWSSSDGAKPINRFVCFVTFFYIVSIYLWMYNSVFLLKNYNLPKNQFWITINYQLLLACVECRYCCWVELNFEWQNPNVKSVIIHCPNSSINNHKEKSQSISSRIFGLYNY